MKLAAIFGAGSVVGFGGVAAYIQSIQKTVYSDGQSESVQSREEELFRKEELYKDRKMFDHVNYLAPSNIYKTGKHRLEMLYRSSSKSQGFTGVTHGGYTFTILRELGLELRKMEGLESSPSNLYLRYKKPSMVGDEHRIVATLDEDKNEVRVESLDIKGNLVAFILLS